MQQCPSNEPIFHVSGHQAMAARVESSSSVSSMNVAFRCLAEDLPAVFPLFSEGMHVADLQFRGHGH
jgi:hypothetical protein